MEKKKLESDNDHGLCFQEDLSVHIHDSYRTLC